MSPASPVAQACALLEAAHPDSLDGMSDAELRRFGDLMDLWCVIARGRLRRREQPKAGVLAVLKDGERAP